MAAPDDLDQQYRAEVLRLLRLSPPWTRTASGDVIRCLFLPSFHPEWCASIFETERVARVSALDRSAWAWLSARRDGSQADPVKGFVEPGHWDEAIPLSEGVTASLRAGFPPRLQAGAPFAIDGMGVAFEVGSARDSEWREFHVVTDSEGTALARRIAEIVSGSAKTEHVRAAATAALRYFGK